MAQFRKKPVVVEAKQFLANYDNAQEILDWINAATPNFDPIDSSTWKAFSYYGELRISTLEGEMTATNGDWIIQGVAGEFYPCKPDIFEATYERVEA